MTDNIVIGISDMKVSNKPRDVLVTYALGSCIGLSVYDPFARVGGLLHYMLPDSTLDAGKAKENPYMFTDARDASVFKACYALGADKKRMVVRVAGEGKHLG